MKTGLNWSELWKIGLAGAAAIAGFAAFVVHILVARKHLLEIQKLKGELADQRAKNQQQGTGIVQIASFEQTQKFGHDRTKAEGWHSEARHQYKPSYGRYSEPRPSAPPSTTGRADWLVIWALAAAVVMYRQSHDWATALAWFVGTWIAVRLLVRMPWPLLFLFLGGLGWVIVDTFLSGHV